MKIWLGCKSADLDWLSLRHDRLFQVDNEYEDELRGKEYVIQRFGGFYVAFIFR